MACPSIHFFGTNTPLGGLRMEAAWLLDVVLGAKHKGTPLPPLVDSVSAEVALEMLTRCIERDWADILRSLLPRAPFLQAALQNTYLLTKASEHCKSAVIPLIEAGVPVDSPSPSGNTALMLAARDNDVTLTRRLLGHGADPRAMSKFNKTAFCWAVLHNSGEGSTFDLLCQFTPDINKPRERPPIYWTVLFGDEKKTEALLDRGADISLVKKNFDGPADAVLEKTKDAIPFSRSRPAVAARARALFRQYASRI